MADSTHPTAPKPDDHPNPPPGASVQAAITVGDNAPPQTHPAAPDGRHSTRPAVSPASRLARENLT